MRPLLFSDKGFLDTQYYWHAKMAGISAERQRQPLEVPLLSLQAISIKIVVSPVKDKCLKKTLTIASMCIYLIISNVQDLQLEACHVVNGMGSTRNGIHKRPSAPIKKLGPSFSQSQIHMHVGPPLTLSITDQKALFKLSQAKVTFSFTCSFVCPSSRATIDLVSGAVVNFLKPRIRLHPTSVLS